ncbi:GNAT family N-acetyltransferase [Nocardiopsis tropica]|uniref:GNAT family N-acetyltransferase n=1 Tax=Tsukamurella strandjordii TaxID=147577 RepID=UPI0031CDCB26
MTEFAPVVGAQWSDPFERGEKVTDTGTFRLAIDDDLDHESRAQILVRGDRTYALVDRATAGLPGIADAVDERSLRAALDSGGVVMNGPDHLFFLPGARKADLLAGRDAPSVRQLTTADAEAFEAFEAASSDQDLDDAYVELDHWVVFGAFDSGRLVAAGSAYPFEGDTQLADLGVLTLADRRGRGYACAVVHAMARHVIALGYEPQYRCQLDNAGSIALAAKAGFAEFGTWDQPLPADD